jgi:dipeptidyl aminopeptidase/acylaminoacyl peptidase
MQKWKSWIAAAFVAALGAISPLIGFTQEIPVETLFRKSEFRSLTLSPNGKLLAAIAPLKGRYNLAVIDIGQKKIMRITAFDSTDVSRYLWVSDERLVFTTGDQQGFEFRADGGVFAINIDGSDARTLNPPILTQAAGGTVALRAYNPISRVAGAPNEVYVATNERSEYSTDIFRVNTKSGRKTLITFDSPGDVRNWVLDSKQVPRAALATVRGERRSALFYRADDKSPWQEMHSWGPDGGEIVPEAFDSDGKLYVTSNIGRDTKALFEFDIANKKLGRLIYGDDRYDVTPPTLWGGGGGGGFLRFSSEEGERKLAGVSYMADKPKTIWFDPVYEKLQKEIDRALPDTFNNFGALRDVMLVTAASDRDPGTVYLFDRLKPSLTELVRVAQWIDPKQMNEMKPITFTSRDGMRMDGYITLPKTWKPGHPVPMIVHPHGGPWARDAWGFNPEVQFMANRGYAVLQVNFRSSTGYGRKHYTAGHKQWGDNIQDDIHDGALWAIKEGYADPDRIGVYGASFGGYSTLMQIVRWPEMYKFAINYVGVTDMFVHQRTQPAQKRGDFGELAKRLNGDSEVDREMFMRTSPTLHVDRIKAPVMHAYGGEDQNVDPANGEAIKAAFEKAGKPVDYTFVPEEAHGYRLDKNVFMFYNKFDKFIKANTPAK